MDQRRHPTHHLTLSADRPNVKDITKGLLHTIFFHRYFTPLYPATHEILDLNLPYVTEDDIDTLIETRTTTLLQKLDTQTTTSTPSAQIQIQFLEKKRRKGWFVTKPDEETPWESWVIDVSLLNPRTGGGEMGLRRRMGRELEAACMKVLEVVNQEREHIPPITTNESNPFPYHVLVVKGKGVGGVAGGVSSGEAGWSGKMGIF